MKRDYTNDAEVSFSQGLQPIQVMRRQREQLAIEHARTKPSKHQGADPYNTSGSFDRRDNWSRVYKR